MSNDTRIEEGIPFIAECKCWDVGSFDHCPYLKYTGILDQDDQLPDAICAYRARKAVEEFVREHPPRFAKQDLPEFPALGPGWPADCNGRKLLFVIRQWVPDSQNHREMFARQLMSHPDWPDVLDRASALDISAWDGYHNMDEMVAPILLDVGIPATRDTLRYLKSCVFERGGISFARWRGSSNTRKQWGGNNARRQLRIFRPTAHALNSHKRMKTTTRLRPAFRALPRKAVHPSRGVMVTTLIFARRVAGDEPYHHGYLTPDSNPECSIAFPLATTTQEHIQSAQLLVRTHKDWIQQWSPSHLSNISSKRRAARRSFAVSNPQTARTGSRSPDDAWYSYDETALEPFRDPLKQARILDDFLSSGEIVHVWMQKYLDTVQSRVSHRRKKDGIEGRTERGWRTTVEKIILPLLVEARSRSRKTL